MRAAIAESPPVWRVAAALAAVVALMCSLDDRIPIASGIALAALLPAGLVDLIEGRLPNRLVALAALAGTLALVVESVTGGLPITPTAAASGAVVGAAAMAGPLVIARLIAPAAMGFGDVKTALVAGAALGVVDPILGLVALAVGSAATAIIGVLTRRRTIVFGPGLVGGAIVALVLVVSPISPFGGIG